MSRSGNSYKVAELNIPDLQLADVSANVFYQCFDANGREVRMHADSSVLLSQTA